MSFELTLCKSCGQLLAVSPYSDAAEFICPDCREMAESSQDHHDLTQVSMYLSHHPDLLDELTASERKEIVRHLRAEV